MNEQLGWVALENNLKREAANWASAAAVAAAPGASGAGRHRDAGAQPGLESLAAEMRSLRQLLWLAFASPQVRWRSRSCAKMPASVGRAAAARHRPNAFSAGEDFRCCSGSSFSI
jgi:hypothetical protein